jgi:hypothetical protein
VIAYFDTSALVPLIVAEPTSAACRAAWNSADRVVSVRLAYVEAVAALARADRAGRLGVRGLDESIRELDDFWSEMEIVELDAELTRVAAALARDQALRGHDAVHCAAGMSVSSGDFVVVSGDRDLLSAWSRVGMAVLDVALRGGERNRAQ